MSLLPSGAIESAGYNINNSLRFRSSASAYLSRTPGSAGNRTKWTYSAWVKRGVLGTSNQTLLAADTNSGAGATSSYVWFTSSDTLAISIAAGTYYLNSSSVYRDPSAWYHIVAVYDTTQATSSNRLKLYVNGVQLTAFGTATYPTLNYASNINNNVLHAISARVYQSPTIDTYFDGYVAETNFIDGQALTPSDFGETDTTTGVWKPKAYTGTYGTNGFYLKFSDIATTSGSNAGLGKDFSGNTNYWTTNNISVTSGSTYDAMKDSPTNTSATTANYAVLNPLITGNVVTPTNANLTSSVSAGTNAYFSSAGTIAVSSGKWYWECSITARDAGAGQWFQFGIVSSTTTYSNNAIGYSGNMSNAYAYYNDGAKAGNGTGTVGYGATFTTSDIIGIAFDADAGTITFYKNNVSQGQAFSGISSSLSWLPIIQIYGSTGVANTVAINFGQRPFAYTPPTGYLALNTFNLPNPTILQGNKYMDATLYTGNGTSQTITTAASFKPDLVWIKGRSYADFHTWFDTVRGATKSISSDLTTAEVTRGTALTAFTSTGFTVGSDTLVNYNANTLVAWQWQAGQGTTSSNTSGSITSTVSVNTTAGFSVVTYTGTGANATVGHGLGVAPKMIIIKNRTNAYNWGVYHQSLGATKYLNLNKTDASGTSSTYWNNTEPDSSKFYVSTSGDVNLSTNNYVAYCWAEIAGFSKFGSYTGNYNVNGTFVYCGFRPKFILIKAANNAYDWELIDTSRSTYNGSSNYLQPNLSSAEYSTTSDIMDILSNGFKMRNNWTRLNDTITYIYAAFAESPFKNSLAR